MARISQISPDRPVKAAKVILELHRAIQAIACYGLPEQAPGGLVDGLAS